MGIVGKYDLDSLKEPHVQIGFKCPYCKSTRVNMNGKKDVDFWGGVQCPKCGSKVIVDALSVTVIRDE